MVNLGKEVEVGKKGEEEIRALWKEKAEQITETNVGYGGPRKVRMRTAWLGDYGFGDEKVGEQTSSGQVEYPCTYTR